MFHDLLATVGRHRMHEQRGDAQREEAVDKNLATHVSIVGTLGGLNAVSPMLLRPANEVVHERHDRMQFSLVHNGLVFRHGLMAARHHVGRGSAKGHEALEVLLRLVEAAAR